MKLFDGAMLCLNMPINTPISYFSAVKETNQTIEFIVPKRELRYLFQVFLLPSKIYFSNNSDLVDET